MTDIDIQKLRDFMATEVMGWNFIPAYSQQVGDYGVIRYFAKEWQKDGKRTFFYFEWHPDLDSNQLDMLIDKMVEDGFNYEINEWSDGFDNEVVFHRPKDDAIGRISNFNDRSLAVLLAIKAAKDNQ